MTSWEFERDGEVVLIDPAGPLLVRVGAATDLAVDAAIAGTGIIYLFEDWLRPYFDAARSSPCSNHGGCASRDRSSTIPDAAWCRRRCGPLSISSRHRLIETDSAHRDVCGYGCFARAASSASWMIRPSAAI